MGSMPAEEVATFGAEAFYVVAYLLLGVGVFRFFCAATCAFFEWRRRDNG